MTRRRFIADEARGDLAALTGDHASHLAKVLRARVGQEFDIVVEDEVRTGEISSISNDRVEFRLSSISHPQAPQQRELTLLLSIFKFDRLEWAIEKAVELGVSRIVPVIARRTEPHLAKAAAKRVERWRRIARESSQQARRNSEPEVVDPIRLKAAVEQVGGFRIVLSEHESPKRRSLKELVAEGATFPLTLAIGPEGGWATDELQAFQESGWKFASLGPSVLRVETATIVALAIAIS